MPYFKKRSAKGSGEFPVENLTYIPKLAKLLDHVRRIGRGRLIYFNGVLKAFE
jgi:hypothetical protein